jgi:hypothetical protein
MMDGECLKELREKIEMSQAEFASKLEIEQTSLVAMERGELSNPPGGRRRRFGSVRSLGSQSRRTRGFLACNQRLLVSRTSVTSAIQACRRVGAKLLAGNHQFPCISAGKFGEQ